MNIKRTANAGVLLSLDGVSILLDGVCERVDCYMETPLDVLKELKETFPDIVLFTHFHQDHYSEDYAMLYKEATLRSIYGPESFFFKDFGKISVWAVPTRHIGKTDVKHQSFVIKGTKCVWFMGDASPSALKELADYPAPDIVIVPFAYLNTTASFNLTKSFGAKIIAVHLPNRGEDKYGIWDSMEKVTGGDRSVYILKMGEDINL